MSENIQNYIQSDLKFSPSKLYFQHQNQILQKIGFISPMSIDIYFKYTFQKVQSNYFIEGGEFEGISVDHDVNEQGIIYKIGFLNPKFQDIQHLSLDLSRKILDNPSILPLVGGVLGWGVVFGLLMRLYSKGQFWQVLFRLNIAGGSILFLFLGGKLVKFLYKKLFKTKRVDYGGFSVNYDKHSDALMLSSDVMNILKKLERDFWITKFCYTGNCIYLLQDVHDHEGNRLSSSSKLYSEQEKAALQQRTMEYICQSEFLSLFTLN